MATGTGNSPFFTKFGFPLDIRDHSNIKSDFINHPSAEKFPTDVDHYIKTEQEHGALLGPFEQPPIENLHISPFCREENLILKIEEL